MKGTLSKDSMSKFRLVTFDVTNTLLHFRSSVGQVYADTARLFQVQLDVNKANQAFRRHFKDQYRQHPNFGAATGITSQVWWSSVVQRTLSDSSFTPTTDDVVDKISRHLFLAYSTEAQWRTNDGSKSLLTRLKKTGVALGVISNFDERLQNILNRTQLSSYFDFVIASYVVKTAKPDRAIFDLALQRVVHLRIAPSETLHVGDDYDMDYMGARNAGWNALLIKPGSNHEDYIVPDFQSLEKRLFSS